MGSGERLGGTGAETEGKDKKGKGSQPRVPTSYRVGQR